jgi:hypothetical protein
MVLGGTSHRSRSSWLRFPPETIINQIDTNYRLNQYNDLSSPSSAAGIILEHTAISPLDWKGRQ